MRFISSILLAAIFASSCQDKKEKKEAVETARSFFNIIKQGDENQLSEYYPGFKEFDSYYKSDSATITSSVKKNGRWVIAVRNRYINGLGKLNERDIILYISKDSSNKMRIEDSKGLCDFFDKDEFKFGTATGCINKSVDSTDLQIFAGISKAKKLMDSMALDVYIELKNKIKVVSWSWRTGYYSDYASGHGIVRNNSDFSVPDLKYKVTYSNSKGEVITSDDGYVDYDVIEPGESKSFTFYTSYVGNATSASIELKFDESLIYKYLAKKKFTGRECELYYRKLSTKSNTL
ncbi:hypothetical protein JMG10_11845 [Nostoc ellipsosporum NOK]|nr:hypothetical protein [Nostoc ellipsosporum NOK]